MAAATAPGNPGENTLLATTVGELGKLGLDPREIAFDGGYQTNLTTTRWPHSPQSS